MESFWSVLKCDKHFCLALLVWFVAVRDQYDIIGAWSTAKKKWIPNRKLHVVAVPQCSTKLCTMWTRLNMQTPNLPSCTYTQYITHR